MFNLLVAISTWKSHIPHEFNTFKIKVPAISSKLVTFLYNHVTITPSSNLSLEAENFQHYHWPDKISFAIDFASLCLCSFSLLPSFVLILKFFVTKKVVIILNYCHLAFILDYFNAFFTTEYKYFLSNTNLIMQFYFQSLYLKGQCLS